MPLKSVELRLLRETALSLALFSKLLKGAVLYYNSCVHNQKHRNGLGV